MIAKWLINEHQTIGANLMQLVEMGPGKGVLLNRIIEVRISEFNENKEQI